MFGPAMDSIRSFLDNPGNRLDLRLDQMMDLIHKFESPTEEDIYGISLSDSQATGETIENGTNQYQGCYIRIEGINDTVADPLSMMRQKVSIERVSQTIQMHGVIFSDSPLEAAIHKGDILKIFKYTKGNRVIYSWMPSGRTRLSEYTLLPTLIQVDPDTQPSGTADKFNNGDVSLTEDLSNQSSNYDDNNEIPNKGQHKYFIERAHEFLQPYIKVFIYECWVQLGASIKINASYRSIEKQQGLYDAWVNGTPAYQQDNAKPARPGKSYHNVGLAFDFNPTLSTGVTLLKSANTLEEWEQSGVPDIGRQAGLRWGGTFTNNYDPIHFDLGNVVSRAGRDQMLSDAIEQGITANRVDIVL